MMQTSLLSYKTVSHPALSPHRNQLAYGNQTLIQRTTLQISEYAKTAGQVQPKTQPRPDASFSKSSMPALSKSYPALKKLNVAGPKALPCANWGSYVQTTGTHILFLTLPFVGSMDGPTYLKNNAFNLRHVSFFLSTCPPLQEEWQGASIDINAAQKRMLIKEEERGALLFQFENKTYAYRTAHFGAKTSAWHSGGVSGPILPLLHQLLYINCCMGLCRRLSLPVSQIHSTYRIHTGSNPPQLLVPPYLGKSWSLIPVLNGTDGPSNLHL